MSIACPKCGHTRSSRDDPLIPETTCPACGVIYTKAQAYIKKKKESPKPPKQPEPEQKPKTTPKPKPNYKNQFICSSCGHTGKPISVTKGSIWIEIILWLCFFIPGICYSIWRHTSRHKACALCRHGDIIPMESPRGRQLFNQLNNDTDDNHQHNDFDHESKNGIELKIRYYSNSLGERVERKVKAFGLGQFRGRYYVIGYSHSDQERRTYRLEKFRNCINLESGEIITKIKPFMQEFNPNVEDLTDEFNALEQARIENGYFD